MVPDTALTALLRNLVDYAGLFPPAELGMDAMVRRYADGLAGPEAWILERVIVPAGRLDAFAAAAGPRLPDAEIDADADDPSAIWPISVLTAAAGAPELERDLELIARFNEAHRGRAHADTIELRGDDPETIEDALDGLPEGLFPFVELPADRDPRGALAALVGRDAGAKVRTGGVTPELYPSPEALARFIAACAASAVPFKATAGLHHPLRHRAAHVDADEFGFLNVFAGAVLVHAEAIDESRLRDVLVEQDIGAFAFRDESLGWREHVVPRDVVEDARLTFAVSFGSCSIDEPRDDLRQLGLWPHLFESTA